MKTTKSTAFVFSMVAVGAFVLVGGCVSGSQNANVDPVKNWTYRGFVESGPARETWITNDLPKEIVEDYQSFIKTHAGYLIEGAPQGYYENGKGLRAVQVSYSLDRWWAGEKTFWGGTYWRYTLIYNNNNKRVKETRYSYGGYGEF
jgi:hypothetical protein